jgi:hypothetical protein
MEVIKSAIREASGQRLDLRRQCGRVWRKREGNVTDMQGNCCYSVTFVELDIKLCTRTIKPK